MAQRIFKYEIPAIGDFEITMPESAKLLNVQVQKITPVLWVLVDDANNLVKRRFKLFGTGHVISNTAHQEYVGTFQIEEGALVFHLFDLGEPM